MKEEILKHLTGDIIPFWENLLDKEYGGFYGRTGYDLCVDKKALKGGILNSRITWFFSNAYTLLKDESLLTYANAGYEFLRDRFIDREEGGVFWNVSFDGKPFDTMKHTYNHSFAVYALSSYYEASGDEEALGLAKGLFTLIETKCRDENGYLEAFNRDFTPTVNVALSENGVIAERTMNTLLHVIEAYTELFRVSKDEEVKEAILRDLDILTDKIYNKKLHRQEVFFDKDYNSLIDVHSYGHDIETSWLIDRTLTVIDDERYKNLIRPITDDLAKNVYKTAFTGECVLCESVNKEVNTTRVWWIQAESVLGFLHEYEKHPSSKIYLKAAENVWDFIKEHVIDRRCGEWINEMNKDNVPDERKAIEDPWKCPYHNGRMCFEVLRSKVI